MPHEISKNTLLIEYLQQITLEDPYAYLYYILTNKFPTNIVNPIPGFSLKVMKPPSYTMKFDPLLTSSELFKNSKDKKELLHKAKYLLYRTKIIQELKKICCQFGISLSTFFLCIEYTDIVCEEITISSYEQFETLSIICLILAAKFYETTNIGIDLENHYKKDLSSNYQSDEIFILQILKYKLIIQTPYDLLIQIMNIGFLFENETVSIPKMNRIYPQLEKMLCALVESKYYIELTCKQVVLSIIGFVRESLKLDAFSEPLVCLYNLSGMEKFYIDGMNKIKGCFKVKSQGK